MKKLTPYYPPAAIDGTGASVVPHAGSTVLLRTAQAVGLTAALREALAPWRRPLAVHDPGKIVLDLAVSLAIGGDCLVDIAQLRSCPEVFGRVARTGRRRLLHLASSAPFTELVLQALNALDRLTAAP